MKKLIKGSLVGLSFSAIGIADADETKTVQQINVNDTFNIKANQSENTVTKRKPVDLFVAWDGSPSMSGWFMFETIRDVIKSLPDVVWLQWQFMRLMNIVHISQILLVKL